MGTRLGKMVILLALVSLAWTACAWAEEAEEVVALPAPMIAQAPEATPVETPAPEIVQASESELAVTPVEGTRVGGVTEYIQGIAYYYNDRDWEVWISVGALQGLRPYAQVIFVRDGAVIANGVVKRVKEVDAIVTPAKDTPGGAIHLGDAVRIVENGSREALDSIIAREKKMEFLAAIAAGALIWGCIIIAR